MNNCVNGDCDKKYDINELLNKIPSDKELYHNSEIFKAIADPTRLKILYLLSSVDEMCVCQIIEGINKSQSTVSHHLAILKKAGMLNWRKYGIWVYYSLSNPNIIDALIMLLKD